MGLPIDIQTATAMHLFTVSAEEVTPAMRQKAKEFNYPFLYSNKAFEYLRKYERTGIIPALQKHKK